LIKNKENEIHRHNFIKSNLISNLAKNFISANCQDEKNKNTIETQYNNENDTLINNLKHTHKFKT